MKRLIAVILFFSFALNFSAPIIAQDVDLKTEIAQFDLATLPLYADANGEYLKERYYEHKNEQAKEDKERENYKNNDSGGDFRFPEIDFGDGEIIAIAGITTGVVAGLLIVISFFTDENIIFNGAKY